MPQVVYYNDCYCCPQEPGTSPRECDCVGVTIPNALYFRGTFNVYERINFPNLPAQYTLIATSTCCVRINRLTGWDVWGNDYGFWLLGMLPSSPVPADPICVNFESSSHFPFESPLAVGITMRCGLVLGEPRWIASVHSLPAPGMSSLANIASNWTSQVASCSPFDFNFSNDESPHSGVLGSLIRWGNLNQPVIIVTVTNWSITETPCDPNTEDNCCEGGTGSGSGSGTGTGVLTNCCSTVTLPSILYLTVLSGCNCNRTFGLFYNGGNQRWEGTGESCGTSTIYWYLFCTGGSWTVRLECDGVTIFDLTGLTEDSCVPFLLNFSTVITDPNCCPGPTIIGMITETPP